MYRFGSASDEFGPPSNPKDAPKGTLYKQLRILAFFETGKINYLSNYPGEIQSYTNKRAWFQHFSLFIAYQYFIPSR